MANEEKLFYGIGEVAELLQLKPYVLRYWETEFKKLNPQKSFTGQRTYRVRDIQLALTIKKLLYDDKYTIAGAIQKLEELDTNGGLINFPDGTKPALATETNAPETPVVVSAPVEISAKPKEVSAPIETSTTKSVTSVDPEKVRDLKSLVEATKKLLKKYNLS